MVAVVMAVAVAVVMTVMKTVVAYLWCMLSINEEKERYA
jgi:uncharacterized membrane protein